MRKIEIYRKEFYLCGYTKNLTIMAKYTKEEYALAKKQTNDLLKLILQKTGTKHSEIVENAERRFIKANLDVITPAERKQFDRLVFGL